MKKRTASALSALLLCPALLLTSCDKVSESKVKKDPAGLAVQAISLNFEKNETAQSLEKVWTNDSLHISAEAELYGETYALDLYGGGSDGALIFSEGLPFGKVGLYFNDKELALDAEDILDNPIGIKYDDLTRDKILNSTLADEVGLEEDDFDDETWETFEKLRDSLKKSGVSTKNLEKTKKKIGDDWKKIFSDMKPEISTEKVELGDGTVPVVMTTYEIDGDIISDLADAFVDGLRETNLLPEEASDELEDGLTDIADDFDYTFDSFELKTGIAKKNGKLVYAEVNADTGSCEYTITLDLGKDPTKSEEYLLTLKSDDEEIEFRYSRHDEKDDVSRKLKCSVDGDMQFEAKLDWNKKDGDYKLKMSEGSSDVTVTGELKIEKNRIDFVLDENDFFDLPEIKISVDTDTKVPSIPKYTSALDLTEDEINNAYTACAGILYGGFGDYDYDDDDDYDWDDDDYDWDDYDYDWDDDDWSYDGSEL